MTSLTDHTKTVRENLDMVGLSDSTWVRPREGVHDVVIVGSGQSGMGAALGLMRERITNILILDENPTGQEGPWETYARMITLRTPKELTSIDLGIPSLTFRAWWTAQYGIESWEAIDKIPREDWAAYLRWYREALDLPVRNNTRLTSITPVEKGLFQLEIETPNGPETLRARKVVLATGIQGGGEWHTPQFIRNALPKTRYAHTSETIDYETMKGQSIAILGNGASSFDNAQHALKCGVGSVDVFVRRTEIPTVNPIRFMERSGVVPRFAALGDTTKYKVIRSFIERAQPPTNDTFMRSAAWPNFKLHLGSPMKSLRDTDKGVEITTPKGKWRFDYLVLSTGLVTDHMLRPELASVAETICTWGHRNVAPPDQRSALLDAHPYLGEGFEFTPRREEDGDQLYGLYSFNYSALVSLGLSAAALTGLGHAIPRLARSVADQLFLDDQEAWVDDYLSYNDVEFTSSWTPASIEARSA